MPFELQVALRYLLAKRRQVFISVISLVSTLGVTVGVMALVIALALMTGLQRACAIASSDRRRTSSSTRPAGIADYRAEIAKLRAVPGVIGAAPAVMGKALISGRPAVVRHAQGHRPGAGAAASPTSQRPMTEGSLRRR